MKLSFLKFNELTLGDQDFAKELLEVYIEQFEEYIQNLKVLAHHDGEYLAMLNHKIKSSVLVLEAHDLLQKQKQMSQKENWEGKTAQVLADCQEIIRQLQEYSQQIP